MNPKIRKPMAIAALGLSAIVFDVAAWQSLSPRLTAWLESGPAHAVANATRAVATELGAAATRRAADLAMRLALHAAKGSGGLYALVQRASPPSPLWAGLAELPAPAEPSVCVMAASLDLGTVANSGTRRRVVVVCGKCTGAAGATATRGAARRFERLSLQTL